MATTIAELLIKLGVSVEGAKTAQGELEGVNEAATSVDKEGGSGMRNFGATAGKALAAVGAAAIAASVAIFKLVDSVTSAADEVVKGSKAAGLGADEYQRLSFAAKISGTNIKSLSIASKTVARGLNDAATKGTGPFVEGLELVGLRLEDVANIPFEQQLGVFADAISNLDTESEKLAASQLLLGSRAGPQLATFLAEGSAGIKALGDEAERTGGVLGGEALQRSADFQDSIVRLKTAVGGIVNEIGTELAPVVQEIIDDIKEWTVANGGLIAKDIKNFLRQTIPVIKALSSAVGTIVGAIKGFIDVMGGWKSAMGLAATATIGFKLALAGTLGPIGAIGLAIGALVSVVAGLVNQFDDVNDALSETEARSARLRRAQARGKSKEVAGIEERLREAEELELGASTPALRKGFADAAEQARSDLQRQLKTEEAVAKAKREQESIEQGARTASRGAARSFVERRRAGGRVREKLGQGKKADKLVQQVITGKITEEEALGGGRKRGKGGGGRKAKAAAAAEAEATSDVTLAESLLAIRTGTADPKQLKQVIQQLSRKTPSTKAIKPTVAIDFFNFSITQSFKGGDPVKVAKESAKAIRGEFEKATARAGQTIPTGVVR